VIGRFRATRFGAIVIGACVAAGCHPPAAQGGADACTPPPAWRLTIAKPGLPDLELAACLKDKAYQARAVRVPAKAKTAGLIAQCEVEVDQLEGSMVLGGGSGSEQAREALEQRAQQEATAAVAAYQACP